MPGLPDAASMGKGQGACRRPTGQRPQKSCDKGQLGSADIRAGALRPLSTLQAGAWSGGQWPSVPTQQLLGGPAPTLSPGTRSSREDGDLLGEAAPPQGSDHCLFHHVPQVPPQGVSQANTLSVQILHDSRWFHPTWTGEHYHLVTITEATRTAVRVPSKCEALGPRMHSISC